MLTLARSRSRESWLLIGILFIAAFLYLTPVLAGNCSVGDVVGSSVSSTVIDSIQPKLAGLLGVSTGVAAVILQIVVRYGTQLAWVQRALFWSGLGFMVASIIALGLWTILLRYQRTGWWRAVNW